MFRRPLSVFPLIAVSLAIAILPQPTRGSSATFIGEQIPERLSVGSPYIFSGSDSLYLNGRLLPSDSGYTFRTGEGYFDLSGINAGPSDTLRVTYTALPNWLAKTYGRPLPEVSTVGERPPLPETIGDTVSARRGGEVQISGAKSFRVTSRSAGGSEFNQSLDLNITGELTPGLYISGAITDRGYNPAYGTANSRLNELDKINIKLRSQRLEAQIGDITFADFTTARRDKDVSGASFMLTYPRWHAGAAAARPRGQFESFTFLGQDGLQGPYQIGAGTNARPVVPGSETVWLDGRRLERGTSKDYTIDYPTGRVTFNVNHPIDSRSRVEVDYEPQATAYKKELFGGGGGALLADSLFYFSVGAVREGDDSQQPLGGELSDQDRALLAAAGDSIAVKSGVVADTNGNYVLVVDSLPDSVYAYVGTGNGDYRVNFSYVGAGKGSYRFLGNDQYVFVGTGQGDYLPVTILAAPQRTDQFQALLGWRNGVIGEVTADIRESRFDRNLLSSRDDADNDGTYYDLGLNKAWLWNGRNSNLSLERRLKQAAYRDRSRINAADFDREYLLPFGYQPNADELLHRADVTLTPLSWLRTTSFFSHLDYKNAFTSRTGGVVVSASPAERLQLDASWAGISSDLDSAGIGGDGTANTYIGSARYNIYRSVTVGSRFERDIRQNNYSADEHGTRYSRMELEAGTATENVLYEYYAEDSIIGDWTDVLRRNRVTGTSVRNFGRLSYDLMLSYQWLEQQATTLDNFLGRLGLGYQNPQSRLNVTASYLVSEEDRNARGITYLEVEPGQGNYILEDGQYLPDPDGNYIQVEEILSNSARVRRGEKSFQISKNWSVGLFRFNSRIEEELLESGERKIWWAIPFLSDADQPYLFFSRRYDGDVRLIPVAGFYVINLSASEDLEKRDIAGATRRRRDIKGRLSLKQKLRETYFEEYVEPFSAERDAYYSASGDVDGFTVGTNLRQLISAVELTLGGSYRRATSKADERSDIYAVATGSRFPVISRGELRASLELYRQIFENLTGNPSYQLTGNRPGGKGAIWSVAFNYGIRAGLRINFSLSGRHSDNRTARLFGRGEVVAGF